MSDYGHPLTFGSFLTPGNAELAQIHDLIEQVAAGLIDVGSARSHINTMTMRQNKWTLGTDRGPMSVSGHRTRATAGIIGEWGRLGDTGAYRTPRTCGSRRGRRTGPAA
jgi:hypothetical protein